MTVFITAFIASFMTVIALKLMDKGFNMNYKKFISNIYEELRIVLACTFVVGYIIGSLIVFICTWALDKLDHDDSDYTIDLEVLGRKMHLTTKESR